MKTTLLIIIITTILFLMYSFGNSSNNIEQDPKDWVEIAKISKKKIGEKTFNKLTEAYLNDPDTEFYEYMKNKKSDNSGAMGIIVKGLFSKIDTLYAEMSKDSSRMKAK